jgi:hypothetical protein
MSNPISCLFVHQGKEVFHITLDLDPHFIGSLSRSDIWFEVVDVSFHQSDDLAIQLLIVWWLTFAPISFKDICVFLNDSPDE